jgi:hypothetical protein
MKDAEADRPQLTGKAAAAKEAERHEHFAVPPGTTLRAVPGIGMPRETTSSTREVSAVQACDLQPDAREGEAGPRRDGGEVRSTVEAG